MKRVKFAQFFYVMMRRIIYAFFCVSAVAGLLFVVGCGKKEKPKVVEVKTVAPEQASEEALDSVDVAMLCRSLVDALNMDEKLDSSYNFHGIFTDGAGKALYSLADGRPGAWDVQVDGPGRVFMRNSMVGIIEAEDLRVYIARSIGLSDNDIMDAGVVEGNDKATGVIYTRGKLRMEVTLLPEEGADGVELYRMSIAFIRL